MLLPLSAYCQLQLVRVVECPRSFVSAEFLHSEFWEICTGFFQKERNPNAKNSDGGEIAECCLHEQFQLSSRMA